MPDISVPLSVRVMVEVVMASSMGSFLLATEFPVASRIEIRLLSETRSVLEYLRKLSANLHIFGDDKRGVLTISLESRFFGSENTQTTQNVGEKRRGADEKQTLTGTYTSSCSIFKLYQLRN